MIYSLDITQEHCPMTLVRTKIMLSQMKQGDQLEVILSEGEPLDNIPKSVEQQGFKVLSVEHLKGTTYKVIIEK